MKLEDWLIDGHAIRDPAGLHVIGTCGECKIYGSENFLTGEISPRKCLLLGIEFRPEYGCIDFEQKEGS